MRHEEECWIALHHVKGLKVKQLAQLVERFSSATSIVGAAREELLEVVGSASLAEAIATSCYQIECQRSLMALRSLKGWALSYWDPTYPASLRSLAHPPWFLYGRGDPALLHAPSIAIVGTRSATPYGMQSARLFAKEIAASGTLVVSGLARGIDTAAHEGALETGSTIACLGSGLSQLYPKENIQLAERIAERGLLLSEVAPLTPPERYLFPKRNRIISALARATLLIEAPEDSGAVHTLQHAQQQGKRVFALPGRWDMPSFQANHSWIRQQKATLVENPQELLSNLSISKTSLQQRKPALLTEDEENLLRLIPTHEITLDELVLISALPLPKVASLLIALVLKGEVRECVGGRFLRDG